MTEDAKKKNDKTLSVLNQARNDTVDAVVRLLEVAFKMGIKPTDIIEGIKQLKNK
jgi:hypothetical protein